MSYKVKFTQHLGDGYFGRIGYKTITRELPDTIHLDKVVKSIRGTLHKNRVLCGHLMYFVFLSTPNGDSYRITEDSIEKLP